MCEDLGGEEVGGSGKSRGRENHTHNKLYEKFIFNKKSTYFKLQTTVESKFMYR